MTRLHLNLRFSIDDTFSLNSEVETADDADDADNQELGGESGRMSPKPTPQLKPVYHP